MNDEGQHVGGTEPPRPAPSGLAASQSRSRASATLLVVAVVAAVTVVDLAVKAVLAPQLSPNGITGAPIDLALSYNTGVGLSVGARLPRAVVPAVTTAIIAAITALTLRSAWRGANRWRVVGMSLAVGGALGNLIDRVGDGAVTDYLRLPWFTCNLADVAITVGVAAVMLTLLVPSRPSRI